jgi:NAD(P)-dependent dehydrogenase (short-subunit alcohol dehydrogenase family)
MCHLIPGPGSLLSGILVTCSLHGLSGFTNTAIVQSFNDQTGNAFIEDNLSQLFKRYADPAEIASLIGFLLGDESKFTTKSIYNIDGGFRG